MKKKIAIAMGGYSSEYEISIKSGNVVYKHLNKEKYEVYRAYIKRDRWFVLEDEREYSIDKTDFSITINNEKVKFDCVFNVIHGTPGEDGLLAAYWETVGIPQTSCGHYQAALTFNKRDCISVLRNYGIKTASNYFLNKGDEIDIEKIINQVGLPCFVKANKGGSSFGISKVKQKEELLSAIEHSFEEDDEIIIETCLVGTEVDVSVIDFKGELKALPVTEIVPDNEFFDYDAKYLGKSQEITPARIDESQTRKVQELTKKIIKLLKLEGFPRTEFIIQDGEPYFLETNTNPGLSEASVVPQQALAAGISLEELFGNEVERALREL